MGPYDSNVTRALRGILDASGTPMRVIEIGTAWGGHLHILKGCNNLEEILCIDPMYDWVPDLGPDVKFDNDLVSNEKVESWHRNSEGVPATLVIAKSADAARAGTITVDHFDIVLIDGCHHPAAAVSADYWDFVPFLKHDHIIIFDDINHSDPGTAANEIELALTSAGRTIRRDDLSGGAIRVLYVSSVTDL